MFTKVLIANRGEIACRVMRTCRRRGIATVAVHSDADAGALHVALADEAVRIGPPPAAESYLDGAAILAAAQATGAQAIHPGYGFLAENAGFARAVAEAGLVFIGPSPEAIEIMGAKDRAKAAVRAFDVPLVPDGGAADDDLAALHASAERLGLPLMVKAAAGGGGKGMRVVRDTADLKPAIEGAMREARAAFGDPRLLLERFLDRPRHVEVQVFGDAHGNVVHLHERDCSLQRRHQKVIEEAPAPGLTPELRTALGEAAVQAARSVGYTGAGTVEFLLEPGGGFHFIEMNTRLQVEHPVTEMITGLDLVEWQLLVAAGAPLPLHQDEIDMYGHAFEARLYAEDPARGFLPSTGRLDHLRLPDESRHVRVETGVRAGDTVTPFYDPMIAKLVTWADTRAEALRLLHAALAATEVVGVTTNRNFLATVAADPAFATQPVDVGWLDREQDRLVREPEGPSDALALACARLLHDLATGARTAAAASGEPGSPWHRVDGWRLNGRGHVTLELAQGGERIEIDARPEGSAWRLTLPGVERLLRVEGGSDGLVVHLDGKRRAVRVPRRGADLTVLDGFATTAFRVVDRAAGPEDEAEAENLITAPMPGRVVKLFAATGAAVEKGAPLLVLEAMKMEHTLTAAAAGVVGEVRCAEGEQVEEGRILIAFEAPDGAEA